MMRSMTISLAASVLALTGCSRGDGDAATVSRTTTIPVKIAANGRVQVFRAELARTK